MSNFQTLLAAIAQEMADLRSLENEIRDSGPVAPAKVTIDSSANAKGKTYHRLRSPGQKARSLKADELKDWQQRIKRRNALRQIERQVAALMETKVLLSQGIDWEPEPGLEIDQSVYMPPAA